MEKEKINEKTNQKVIRLKHSKRAMKLNSKTENFICRILHSKA